MRASTTKLSLRMTPIRNHLSGEFIDLQTNQISNGAHLVRPKISAEICRGAGA